jgi:hypothetical protein
MGTMTLKFQKSDDPDGVTATFSLPDDELSVLTGVYAQLYFPHGVLVSPAVKDEQGNVTTDEVRRYPTSQEVVDAVCIGPDGKGGLINGMKAFVKSRQTELRNAGLPEIPDMSITKV